MTEIVLGNYLITIFSILSGEDQQHHNKKLATPTPKTSTLFPILSKEQYKYPTHSNKALKAYSTTGILEEGSLQKQLLKECAKTSKLIQISSQIRKRHQQKDQDWQENSYTPEEKKQRNQDMSPGSLQRRYLPRNTTDTRRNHPPHPAAARAAPPLRHRPRPRRHLGCGRAGAKMAGPN
ncbi:ORF3 [Torque teno midi virus 4]|uniref:ORF3 n=1 Tax=Torque teno midi virus 4 TaxID=2065045 RepID=A8DMP5_9VIRU|nr:ORF3 [Torque teno midi virus 4]ABU55879.1 ORF3 [Torque teno midi virus 4]